MARRRAELPPRLSALALSPLPARQQRRRLSNDATTSKGSTDMAREIVTYAQTRTPEKDEIFFNNLKLGYTVSRCCVRAEYDPEFIDHLIKSDVVFGAKVALARRIGQDAHLDRLVDQAANGVRVWRREVKRDSDGNVVGSIETEQISEDPRAVQAAAKVMNPAAFVERVDVQVGRSGKPADEAAEQSAILAAMEYVALKEKEKVPR
jgi:hypothetical protein